MLSAKTLKIALGDLRHGTVGRHSVLMPIAISYIASYTLSKVGSDNVEIRLYDNPDIILKDIERWKPTVIGLSNYCWNAELSRLVFAYAKKVNPDIVCVAGGPEFPDVQADCRAHLLQRKEIDFYVYREGEVVFADLIKELQQGTDVLELKSKPREGIMSIHPHTGDLVACKPAPRLKNLDEIPPPYSSGLLDKWFNGRHAPSIETTRGCPFSCGYCHMGLKWHSTIARFSVERLKAELNYIARRMTAYPDIRLSICDTNFGMYKRDEEIAEHIGRLQDEFGWPNAFDASTGHINYDRVLRVISILKNKMNISCSLQSLNPKTLEVIKRENPPMNQYSETMRELKRRGMRGGPEFIVPMPEETKESFFEGIRSVFDAGVSRLSVFTTMLLKATYLNSQECREKYQMQTKFRLIPRQFGEYAGQKCFEVEKVCVATNTMPFEDYLDCRGLAFISSLLSSEQFDLVSRHLAELGISKYKYIHYIWELVSSGETELSKIYNEYIDETQKELWDSKESIYEYFTKQENYEKLLSGDLGDNLSRKYEVKALLKYCRPVIKMAYSAIRAVAGESMTREVQESLDAAERWALSVRDMSFLRDGLLTDNVKTLHLPYDVYGWYLSGSDSDPLASYNTATNYKIFYNSGEPGRLLGEGKRVFGGDFSYHFGKIILHWGVKKLWRKCEPVAKESSFVK